MKAEFVLIILNRLQRRQLDAGVPRKAARINAPRVIACLAMRNHLRQEPAMPAAFTKSRAQARNTKRIALVRDWSDKRRAINRIGDRPVDDRVNSHLCQSQAYAPSRPQMSQSPAQDHQGKVRW